MPEALTQSNGRAQNIDHVQISYATDLKIFFNSVDHNASSLIDIDTDLLSDTLSEFGEYDDPEKITPLEIKLLACRYYNDLSGFANFVKDDKNKIVLRQVFIPIFTVFPASEDFPHGICKYDPHRVNRTIRHELKHAVDFLDPKLLALSSLYRACAGPSYSYRGVYKNNPIERRAVAAANIGSSQVPHVIKMYKQK